MTYGAARMRQLGEHVFDVEKVRDDFPILSRKVYNRPLVYLDTAASAQKPQAVIDAMSQMMAEDYANIHRGVYYLSQRSTDAFEAARAKVAKFINAASADEIVFTRNATESINLVAASWGRKFLGKGDEVLLTEMEHHANIVPWQLLKAERGIEIKVAPIDNTGALDMAAFAALVTPRTKLIAVTHMSNALGTITPVREIVALAHAQNIPVLLDGCQSIVHLPIDVQALGCDFFVFSGHKLYGPSGIGVLYGKFAQLEKMPPYQGGGDMIERVTFAKTTFRKPPARFEAGTPAIIEAVGLGAAIDYISQLGRQAIADYEDGLLTYMTDRLSGIDGLTIHGTAKDKAGVVSFTMAGIHAHDIGTIVDNLASVAIRVGHHCAQPLMDRLGIAATARASVGMYNTREDIDVLAGSLEKVREIFGK
jgi:cysteine desulfurase/selenocysteine lyase